MLFGLVSTCKRGLWMNWSQKRTGIDVHEDPTTTRSSSGSTNAPSSSWESCYCCSSGRLRRWKRLSFPYISFRPLMEQCTCRRRLSLSNTNTIITPLTAFCHKLPSTCRTLCFGFLFFATHCCKWYDLSPEIDFGSCHSWQWKIWGHKDHTKFCCEISFSTLRLFVACLGMKVVLMGGSMTCGNLPHSLQFGFLLSHSGALASLIFALEFISVAA